MVIDSIQTMLHPQLDSGPGSVGPGKGVLSLPGSDRKGEGHRDLFRRPRQQAGKPGRSQSVGARRRRRLQFRRGTANLVSDIEGGEKPLRLHPRSGHLRDGPKGLAARSQPSRVFLAERPVGSPGSVVTASREGTRPLLVEIQALVARPPLGVRLGGRWPESITIGSPSSSRCWKNGSASLADTRCICKRRRGSQIGEPACDLAVAVAVARATKGGPSIRHRRLW